MAPLALSVAGSDPSGGAGLQADIKAFLARDVDGAAVTTAVTFQGAGGVRGTRVLAAAEVQAQLDCIWGDARVQAAKTGMLGRADVVEVVARACMNACVPLVVDPVIRSGSGHELLDAAGVRSLVDRLLPLCRVVTPNAEEAAVFLDRPVRTEEDALLAARAIQRLGAPAVLLKGGHLRTELAVDVLVDGLDTHVFRAPRQAIPRAHGTGCLLSAMITAELAKRTPLPRAVELAKAALARALAGGTEVQGVLVPDVLALRAP